MHPSVEALQRLPPRSQRTLMVYNAPPVPIYFLQVPQAALQNVRGSFAAPPPIWPADAPVDIDGQRTWCIVCSNRITIYIRSQPVPNDPPGVWALSPSQEEIFIPQSLLEFEIRELDPTSPPMPPPAPFAGPRHVPTVMTHLTDQTFRGRRCKVCGGQHSHDVYCPSIHPGFSCQWCLFGNGVHQLGCSGFTRQ